MYHPASEDPREEYIELFNRGAEDVNLSGWKFTGGVRFAFGTNTVIRAGGFLVVAANVTNFTAKYPGMTNVVGNWQGTLSNSRNDIDLDDASGARADSVRYADEGDWAVRRRGEPSPTPTSPYRGWVWYKEHDGMGKSLELINPALGNQHGQNWAASMENEGTPGAPNSVAATDLAPLIVQVQHLPIIPHASDDVTVIARIIDEQTTGVTVTLHHRVDAVPANSFSSESMFDDGAHGDGAANDGIYGAFIPAEAHGTVVEFYVEASDAGSHTRTWPAPVYDTNGANLGQVANALYQVDTSTYSGDQPIYRLIMTERERVDLAVIQAGGYAMWPSTPGLAQSDAQMNGTFISVEGTGAECRYLVGIKNRGHGTRNRKPNNFRVNFVSDTPWKGVGALNLNGQYTHVQVFGAALCQLAGVAGGQSRAVQVRVNSTNLALGGTSPLPNFDRTYGSYAANEVINADWAERQFPDDPNGNAYRVVRDITTPSASFDYRGANWTSYTNTYYKRNNESENDWSDLMAMLQVMGGSDMFTTEDVRRVVNVEQWMKHIAIMAIFGNNETGINTGWNDDYNIYIGRNDPRALLVYYDLDTIVGQGGSLGTSATIWGATTVHSSQDIGTALNRFMHWPEFEPIYYYTLQQMMNTTFSKVHYDELLDRTLGGYVPGNVISNMKIWMDSRRTYIQSVINPYLATNPPPATLAATVSGEPRSPTPLNFAALTVGGEGITHYRYKLNNASYGPETPVGNPILLSALAPSSTNTVTIIGRTADGTWQPRPTVSRTWVVNANWPAVRINEVLAWNDFVYDHHGTFPDVIELYNEGASAIDLSGMRLTDNTGSPDKFTFPAGSTLAAGAYLVLYANNPDGTPGTHLGFGLDYEGESVYLFDRIDRGGALLDSVIFGQQVPDKSIGRAGNAGEFVLIEPSAGNNNSPLPLGNFRNLKINEWLAAAQSPFAIDYIEIYNPETLPVCLSGLHLTDTPIGAPALHTIAPLSFIDAGGFVPFMADGSPSDGARHLSFQLASEQGQIALSAPDFSIIDQVIYGPQQPGVPLGRCPDGSETIRAQTVPTPGIYNFCPAAPPQPQTVSLVAMTNFWRYDMSGSDLGTAWLDPNYDDSSWLSGQPLFHDIPRPDKLHVARTSPHNCQRNEPLHDLLPHTFQCAGECEHLGITTLSRGG